jgi:nucleoside-diphosphate-sugar epimerase
VNGADAEFMVQNNLVGSLHCFEFARRRRAAVIFLSTSRVYPYDALNRQEYREEATRFVPVRTSAGFGPEGVGLDFPLAGARSLYGATKLASEIMLQEYSRQYDLPAVIDRCGVIAGPWQLGKQDQGVFTYWLVSHLLKRRSPTSASAAKASRCATFSTSTTSSIWSSCKAGGSRNSAATSFRPAVPRIPICPCRKPPRCANA